MEKRKTRFKDLHCTSYLATAIIVATVKLTSTSAWTEHCPSWFQGCIHTVLLQKKRPKEASEALLQCCRGTVGTVGLSDYCRTVGLMRERLVRGIPVGTVGQLSDTVGLSDCRTVGLSENCRTLSESTVGLSDRVQITNSYRHTHKVISWTTQGGG